MRQRDVIVELQRLIQQKLAATSVENQGHRTSPNTHTELDFAVDRQT
jgi:hypothetical protein